MVVVVVVVVVLLVVVVIVKNFSIILHPPLDPNTILFLAGLFTGIRN